MIQEIKPYWDVLQCISESFDSDSIEKLIENYFSSEFLYKTWKTSKDEVLQIYNDLECYTFIGGSSADKYEWSDNFDAFPLVYGFIHQGFFDGCQEVLNHKDRVSSDKDYFCGYSRGSAVASVCCFETGCSGVGFGTPKAFSKKLMNKLSFYNVINSRDPVTHVVPFFKTAGKVIEYKFGFPMSKRAHTDYGKYIREGDTLWKI